MQKNVFKLSISYIIYSWSNQNTSFQTNYYYYYVKIYIHIDSGRKRLNPGDKCPVPLKVPRGGTRGKCPYITLNIPTKFLIVLMIFNKLVAITK